MSLLLAIAALFALAGLQWPALFGRPALHPHMVLGGSRSWNALFLGAIGATWLTRLVAIPAILWLANDAGGLTGLGMATAGLGCLLLCLGALGRREPRSCAAPMRDDAVFLGLVAPAWALVALWDGQISPLGALSGVGTGLLLTASTVGVLALGFRLTWGLRPRFFAMRRPNFRVLADNPDSYTVLCRVRIGTEGLLIELPRVAEGPTSLAVYDARLRSVAGVPWSILAPRLAAQEHVACILGGAPGSLPGGLQDAVHLPLPQGDYLLSCRNYRPFDRGTLPAIRVLS